tara:strand:- start:126 stop:770 length:645 start_codon:yes stop_codon:yes gene_type:complete
VQILSTFKNIKPVVAIDGTAGSGKGTLAKSLAKKLEFNHLDTGILYRIYAYESLYNKNNSIDLSSWFKSSNNFDKLRTEKISQLASTISQQKKVRESLVEVQREFADNPPNGKGSVIDGRDIGSVIIPNAEVKFFIDAKVEIRANRRIDQLKLDTREYKNILMAMISRDEKDINREISPLVRTEDSYFIDSSHVDASEVLEMAIKYIKKSTDFI